MTMHLKIKSAGVIGAGTMGAGVAAHLANCGIRTLLLDIVPPELTEEDKAKGLDRNSLEFRNRIAGNAIKAMAKAKPSALYDPGNIKLIAPGNIEDDFDKLTEADWIIEAVPEKLEIKHSLFKCLESIHHKGQIVSSNTSGIALNEITKGRSPEFLSHVMITHFFNPPRHMHLLELVAGKHTNKELFGAFVDFAGRILGKGVITAKDTTNFIGNRIGIFDLEHAFKLAVKQGLKPEEADAIAGPLMGRPKSGIFRLLDIIGIDVQININANLFGNLPDDNRRDVFAPDEALSRMFEKGLLGNKTQAGFYKKSKDADGKRVFLSLDTETLEYSPSSKPEFESLKTAQKQSNPADKLKTLIEFDDAAGKYSWEVLSNTLCYAAERIPEISDDIISVDNALKWGFNWEKGPFELWDAIGVRYIVDRLKKEKRKVPALVTKLLESGKESFYGFEKERPVYFNLLSGSHTPMPQRTRVIILENLKKANKVVKQGEMASIIDLGDGIICLEFHSKANTITSEVTELIQTAVQEAEKNFRGLIVGNQGPNFCLGADLKEMAGYAQGGNIDKLDEFIDNLQSATMALKYCHIPTVAAMHRMVLGAGCELAMQCCRIQAAPETYIGLVESGVGLIPAGGGCKEWAIRCSDWIQGLDGANSFAKMKNIIEMTGMAKTSASAAEARKMGYLLRGDEITMNRDSLIYSAKQLAVQLSEQGYRPPLKNNSIQVMGRGGIAEFKVRSNMWKQGNFISEYDEFVLNKLVYVLCGGNVPDNSEVSEQYLLDLEREVFVSLIGQEKTQQRIEHTLKTGKPLKN